LEYVTTGPVFYPKDLLGGIDKALYVLWGNWYPVRNQDKRNSMSLTSFLFF
jgi:hypothetical protein